MSKPPLIYQGCLRKIRITNLDRAIKKAREKAQRYYFCNCCLGYHLTKSETALAPDSPPKEKPIRVKTKGLRFPDNSTMDITAEDEVYYWGALSKKKKYHYLYVIDSPWEDMREKGCRIKKVDLEDKGYRVIEY